MLGTHTIDECFHSFSEFHKTFMSVSSIIMHIIYVLVFISNEIKAVSNSPVMFSNFLSFRLFIFWNHIAFPWLSMTFTWIPWISRPGNWNHKFYDFPGFPWPEWTLKRDTSYPEEVHLWLKHLEDVACNRKWGAKKAAAKRREGWTNLRQRTDMSNVSCTCNSDEPPFAEDNNDEDDDQLIEWVACDSCAEWHHIACVEINNIPKWPCTSCK